MSGEEKGFEIRYFGEEELLSGKTCSVCGQLLGPKVSEGAYDISGGLQLEFETGEWSHLDCEKAMKQLGILYSPGKDEP